MRGLSMGAEYGLSARERVDRAGRRVIGSL